MVEGTCDSGWKSHLMSSLTEAWKDELHTDLLIITSDGQVQGHKVVMAAASPYFKALLSSGLKEQHTATVRLEDISTETLLVVMEYIYSGTAKFSLDETPAILSLADYFQIYPLKSLCCYYLKTGLCLSNCLPIYEVATLHRCWDLANTAIKMAAKSCTDLVKQEAFQLVSSPTLLALLNNDHLTVESEATLVKAILDWVENDPSERVDLVPSLIKEMDLHSLQNQGLLSRELQGLLESKNLLGFLPACTGSTRKKKRISSNNEEQVLLVIGGENNGRITGSVECFSDSWSCSLPDFNGDRQRNLNDLIQADGIIPSIRTPRIYAASTSCENKTYILGGQSGCQFLDVCEVYDGNDNTWSSLPSLPYSIHGSGSTFLDGNLYCIGGRSKYQHVDDVMIFNTKLESWQVRGHLQCGRVHVGVAALHGSVYVIGGAIDGKGSEIVASCEKYNPDTNSTSFIAPMSHPRAYHGVAVLDNHIYAIGGYDGSKWLNSVERYDPFIDQWTTVASMMGCRSSFGVTVRLDRIYCLGGFNGQSVVNSVEKYNSRTNMWHGVQSMKLTRFSPFAATLHLPGL